MRVGRRAFRQSFVVTVVAGSGVAGACSNGEAGGPVANPPPAHFPSSPTGGSAGFGTAGFGTAGNTGGLAGSSSNPTSPTGGANSGSPDVTGGTSSEATAGSAGGGAPPVAGAAGAGGPSLAGAAGTMGNPAGCPDVLPVTHPSPCETGLTCSFPYTCKSGAQSITRTCKDDRWVGPSGCDKPYDTCEGVVSGPGQYAPEAYCDDDEWHIFTGLEGASSNPPTPCPVEPPEPGTTCDHGGTGGTLEPCGYPCTGDASKWTVLSCPPDADDPYHGTWSSDGACD